MRTCEIAFETLSAYVDGELSREAELELRRHLDGCEGCRARVEGLLALKEAVTASVEVRPVPHTLRERLRALGPPRRRRPIGHALVALAATTLAAVGVAEWARRSAGPSLDGMTQALVADHVHYLHEPDPLQVASSDPERVAAWFDGKVPFRVEIPRLRGATLLGGRLCSLRGHKAALALYEAGGKRLSLFVADPATFPVPPRRDSVCTSAPGDYRVCLVPSASTTFAMVGDAEQASRVMPELQAGVPEVR